MRNVKSFWIKMTPSRRLGVLKENFFLRDLSDFEYSLLPEDFKKVLKREMERQYP